MVFFTCNACGESLKKAQVDKHVNMCRGCQVLSCIDCGKDFWGDDYKNHNKCISEDQKYGGKNYEAKTNKGDAKQQEWIQKIHEAMNKPGVSAKLRDVLRQVSAYDNVPRKKAKFQNWMRNSLKISNTSLHDEVWNILSAADSAPEEKQESVVDVKANTNGAEEQNGRLTADKKKKTSKQERKEARQQNSGKTAGGGGKAVTKETGKKKKKKDGKRKREDEEQNENGVEDEIYAKKSKVDKPTGNADVEATEDQEDQDDQEDQEDQAAQGKFNWKGNIKAVLRESPDQELSVKKLRKKVVAAYYSFTGDGNFKTEEEVLALFNKKINKNPKLRVLKDRVRLVK